MKYELLVYFTQTGHWNIQYRLHMNVPIISDPFLPAQSAILPFTIFNGEFGRGRLYFGLNEAFLLTVLFKTSQII